MTNQEIANRLFELCKQGQFETAQKELFAAEATSTESDMKGNRVAVKGLEAIAQKGQHFRSSVEEMFGGYTNEPKVLGNYIFMEMGMDVKMKDWDRMKMDEMCKYEIKDGKIISEEFFY